MEITYENNDDWLNRCLSSMDFIGKIFLKWIFFDPFDMTDFYNKY